MKMNNAIVPHASEIMKNTTSL